MPRSVLFLRRFQSTLVREPVKKRKNDVIAERVEYLTRTLVERTDMVTSLELALDRTAKSLSRARTDEKLLVDRVRSLEEQNICLTKLVKKVADVQRVAINAGKDLSDAVQRSEELERKCEEAEQQRFSVAEHRDALLKLAAEQASALQHMRAENETSLRVLGEERKRAEEESSAALKALEAERDTARAEVEELSRGSEQHAEAVSTAAVRTCDAERCSASAARDAAARDMDEASVNCETLSRESAEVWPALGGENTGRAAVEQVLLRQQPLPNSDGGLEGARRLERRVERLEGENAALQQRLRAARERRVGGEGDVPSERAKVAAQATEEMLSPLRRSAGDERMQALQRRCLRLEEDNTLSSQRLTTARELLRHRVPRKEVAQLCAVPPATVDAATSVHSSSGHRSEGLGAPWRREERAEEGARTSFQRPGVARERSAGEGLPGIGPSPASPRATAPALSAPAARTGGGIEGDSQAPALVSPTPAAEEMVRAYQRRCLRLEEEKQAALQRLQNFREHGTHKSTGSLTRHVGLGAPMPLAAGAPPPVDPATRHAVHAGPVGVFVRRIQRLEGEQEISTARICRIQTQLLSMRRASTSMRRARDECRSQVELLAHERDSCRAELGAIQRTLTWMRVAHGCSTGDAGGGDEPVLILQMLSSEMEKLRQRVAELTTVAPERPIPDGTLRSSTGIPPHRTAAQKACDGETTSGQEAGEGASLSSPVTATNQARGGGERQPFRDDRPSAQLRDGAGSDSGSHDADGNWADN
jgi:hypothetical protein